MIICGLKLTHDASVAVIEDNKLKFSIELEKINNNSRYESIEDTAVIEDILLREGISPEDVDIFAIDGWGGYNNDALAIQPRLSIGEASNSLTASNQGSDYLLDIAQYNERTPQDSILVAKKFSNLKIGKHLADYESYLHVTGHVMSAYSSSPFPNRKEDSYILIWDGGMFPRLYYYEYQSNKISNLGPLFLLIGNIYTIFSQHFGPFKVSSGFAKDSLSVAGKVMAYIALGSVRHELFEIFDDIYLQNYDKPMGFANLFANEFKKRINGQNYTDEDILTTFHAYLERILVDKLIKKIKRYNQKDLNLCIAGGCGLNIKWNSAIRATQFFKDVYVPPFPNDSGSAIGTACAAMINYTGNSALDWNIYLGPNLIVNQPAPGWISKTANVQELANLIFNTNEPVAVLNGRAELGPRSLGNRSIISSPSSPGMKAILNMVKQREEYRPVAPICLETTAPHYFDPGTPDPFMIFDHIVREESRIKIPAIVHLDGTARLQTVTEKSNPVIAELLTEYQRISGLSVLCNTSANLNGKGFFPDIYSATTWNKINFVWSNGILYEKTDKIDFNKI